jgi:pheromone shutdown protein TraB
MARHTPLDGTDTADGMDTPDASDASDPTETPDGTVAPATAPPPDVAADERHCRHLVRPDGTDLLVVGVVHDHPASVARVRRVCRRIDPDTLALELPRGSLPLYRRLAASDRPASGGEMSAAVAAAPDARLASADPLDARFLLGLARETLREERSLATARSVARRVLTVARRAAGHRLAALAPGDPAPPETERYDCANRTAEEQADHEAAHVSRCSLLAGATEAPPVVRVTDAARERRMAERLAAVDGGTVVAVVGWSHLDALAERLDA